MGILGWKTKVDSIYSHVPRQRCWAHKLRNVSNYLKKKHQDRCISEARALYDAKDRNATTILYIDESKKLSTYNLD